MPRNLARPQGFNPEQRALLQDLSRRIEALPKSKVASGTLLAHPVGLTTTFADVTDDLRFTFRRGREYAVKFFARAVDNDVGTKYQLCDGGTSISGICHYSPTSGGFQAVYLEFPFEGTDVTRVLTVQGATDSGTADLHTNGSNVGSFYVEDLGAA